MLKLGLLYTELYAELREQGECIIKVGLSILNMLGFASTTRGVIGPTKKITTNMVVTATAFLIATKHPLEYHAIRDYSSNKLD